MTLQGVGSDPLVPVLGAALVIVTTLAVWILNAVWSEVKKLRDGYHDLRHDVTVVMFTLDLEPMKRPRKKDGA